MSTRPIRVSYNTDDAFANIPAGTTDGLILAGVTDRRIRVMALSFNCGAVATNATFNSKGSGAGVAISMLFQNGSYSGAVQGWNPGGWFQTLVGESLTLTTGGGSATGVQVSYILTGANE